MTKPKHKQPARECDFSATETRATITPLLRAGQKPKYVAPQVVYTTKAWQTIQYLVTKCPVEIGWLGLVEHIASHNMFLINEIFVPKQEVSGATTEIEADAITALALKLLDEGVDTSQLYYWGHSHVNMGVSPSGQDERQLDEYLAHCPVFIRGIYNKKGDAKVDVFDTAAGVVYQCVEHNPEHDLLPESLVRELDATMKANVIERRFLPPTPTVHIGTAPTKHTPKTAQIQTGWFDYDDYTFRDEADLKDYLWHNT